MTLYEFKTRCLTQQLKYQERLRMAFAGCAGHSFADRMDHYRKRLKAWEDIEAAGSVTALSPALLEVFQQVSESR